VDTRRGSGGAAPLDCRAGLVWGPGYTSYRLRDDHPLNPLRLELTASLIRESGCWPEGAGLLAARAATEVELLAVHAPAYLAAVERLSAPDNRVDQDYAFGLGPGDNPIFPGMHEAAALIAGGTLLGAETVAEGRLDHAFNFAGGLHHALPDRASGFCIYNDPAVAIRQLVDRYDLRVAYVDIDAHHGDGVQWIFYEDPRVLTISLHETGRHLFPGTGTVDEMGRGAGLGYAANVPLEPFTNDESWLECFHAVVPPLLRAFRPDLLVTQHGCDNHHLDPLTHLSCTTGMYLETAGAFHALAHEICGGRWLATGGGGYDIWRVVPRAWTLVWTELSRAPGTDEVAESWRARWAPASPVELPRTFSEPPIAYANPARGAQIAERNRRTVAELKRLLFPIHGLPE